ncbi:MAG: lipase, partial [Actinomycetales bacterium]|nr:lipase [Actinomycetales bacterium]
AFAPAADLYPLAQGVRATTGGKLVSAYIAASWTRFYPGFELSELVAPGYVGLVHRIEGHCFNGANALGAFAIASQLTEEVFRPEVWASDFADLLRVNTPEGDIAAPVLIAQGSADQLVLAEQQRDFVARRCAAGQPIDFREYEGLDHVPLVAEDSPLTPELLTWTRDRLAGTPATPTC